MIGASDDTGWIGAGDGFLVIDRNKDGRIDHMSELSFGAEDPDAASDLEALAALDNNGDRLLDARDARFGELKVWVDTDLDGVSDAGELKTLAELGIKSIGLAGRHLEGTAKVDSNILLSTAVFTRENGSTGTLGNAALAYKPAAAPRNAAALVAMLGNRGEPGLPFGDLRSGLADARTRWEYDRTSIDEGASDQGGAIAPPETGDPVSALDQVMASMIQDMGVFGAREGAGDTANRLRDPVRPTDYFA